MNPTAWELAVIAARQLAERDRVPMPKPWEMSGPPRRRDTKNGHRR